MADSDNDSGGPGSVHELSSLREQDRFLPIANVSRIMKRALPANAKISKDAKETMQECVSEFISFITGEASDKCQREKRKTVNGDDLIWAMTTLGFEEYVEPLKVYLQKFRELEGDKGLPKEGGLVEGANIHAGAMGMTGQSVPMVPGLVREQEVYYQQMRAKGLGYWGGGNGGSSSGAFGRIMIAASLFKTSLYSSHVSVWTQLGQPVGVTQVQVDTSSNAATKSSPKSI